MKFSAPSLDLQKIMGNVASVIPSKSTLPILENFLFEVSKSVLTITATDLDTSISSTLKVTDAADGTIAVPARRITETIRSLPNVDVQFVADIASNKILMKTPNGEYKLTGEPHDNYPTLPAFEGNQRLPVSGEVLRRLITKTSFAVSSDELRPAMMGILFQLRKKEIRTVATDGHRLVKCINTGITSSTERDIVIPAKALTIVAKSAPDSDSNLMFDDHHIMVNFGNSTLVARIIEDKYPNYESVIPGDNNKKLIVDKQQLLASVRRTAIYASTTNHQVRFSLKKGSMSVSAEDIDFGSEARETIPCDYSSEAMEIGFNSAYVIDILSHIDTDEVRFELSTPTRAATIQPVTQREGEDLLMLVMPVRLNS